MEDFNPQNQIQDGEKADQKGVGGSDELGTPITKDYKRAKEAWKLYIQGKLTAKQLEEYLGG
jgi:hypothetical protein